MSRCVVCIFVPRSCTFHRSSFFSTLLLHVQGQELAQTIAFVSSSAPNVGRISGYAAVSTAPSKRDLWTNLVFLFEPTAF